MLKWVAEELTLCEAIGAIRVKALTVAVHSPKWF